MILIVGSEGNQGKRYQAILNYLRQPYVGIDLGKWVDSQKIRNEVKGVIIATPTDTHAEVLRNYMPYGKPILIEKPITKNLAELQELLLEAAAYSSYISMVFQYRQLCKLSAKAPSRYNYFKHGNDGLIWDCLQIIALARGDISLCEDSPIWQCEINGEKLKLSDMDKAYILEVEAWLRHENAVPMGKLFEIHHKVADFEGRNKR